MPKTSRFEGKIGYTDDGFVWMMMDGQNEAGDPIKVTMTLELKDATDIGEHLLNAAKIAATKRSRLILPAGMGVC